MRATGFQYFLEFSSGFSFRGLALTQLPGIHYLDTDLEGIVTTKRVLAEALQKEGETPVPGSSWILEPLNVLSDSAFDKCAEWGGKAPLCLVNEGLLIYFNEAEKRHLCANVRRVLEKRGGCWITGDIYVRLQRPEESLLMRDPDAARFHVMHGTEDNKFDSFAAAESFFASCGLRVTSGKVPAIANRRNTRQSWRLEIS